MIYLLNGSHRKNGFSDKAVKIIAAKAGNALICDKAIEKKVNYCLACNYCETHIGECVLNDDMTAIYDNLTNADKVVIVSPVYFSALPAALKAILDRCQMFYFANEKPTKKKELYLLLLGGSRAYPTQFEGAINAFKYLIKDLNAEYADILKIPDTDRMGDEFSKKAIEEIEAFAYKIIQ